MPCYNHWTIEIPQMVYKESLKHKHAVPDEFLAEVFSTSELCGYGVYDTYCYEKLGKDGQMHYYCDYSTGTSCD